MEEKIVTEGERDERESKSQQEQKQLYLSYFTVVTY